MTFPAVPLDVDVELNLGGTWTEITTYALQRAGTSPPVIITRGRPDETSKATASQCAMQWNNRDGRFSPRNPAGPYYPNLTRNTPVRISVPDPAGTYLRFEDDTTVSSVSAPDTASLQITGTMDVRFDCQLTSYVAGNLVSKWGASGTAWALFLNGDGTVAFTWFDGTNSHTVTSTAALPHLGRIMIRAFLNTTGDFVQFFTAPNMAGSQSSLGSPVNIAPTSVSAAAGQAIQIGASQFGTGCAGKVYEFLLVNSVGTTVADPVFTSATPGASSLTDAQTNVWTLNGTATFSNRSFRGHFECSSLPQRWDTSGTDVWTPVTAAGVLRRKQQGTNPILSVMRRYVVSYPSTASRVVAGSQQSTIGYWPAEDAQGSTQLAAGLAVNTDGTPVAPMTISGVPAFQGTAGSKTADSTFPCSAQLPQVQSSTWVARVPRYNFSFADTPSLIFTLSIPSGGFAGNVTLLTATYGPFQATLNYTTGSGGSLTMTCSGGTTAAITGVNGNAGWVEMTVVGSGSTPATLTIVSNATGSVTSVSTTGTSAPITAFTVNPNGANLGATEMGHFWVSAAHSFGGSSTGIVPIGSINTASNILGARAGEPAGSRIARLCTENGLQARIYGFPAVTALMGAQPVDTLANLFQYCEDADRGILYEPRGCLGIGYRTSHSMLNQAPAVALDYSLTHLGGDQGQGLDPVDDDQYLINDIVVTRSGGSSAQSQVTTGPLSINEPPAGAGDYNTSLTLYCAYDSQLPDVGGWITHVGTADAERYPVIPLNLARTALASLLTTVLAADIGDYVTIANPPAWLPPGPIQVLQWGTTEKLAGFWEAIAWNAVPEIPWEVLVLDDAVYGHLDTDGATLSGALSTGLQSNPFFAGGSLTGWAAFQGTIAASQAAAGGPQPWSCLFTSNGTAGGALEGSAEPFPVTPASVYQASAYVYFPAGGAVDVGVDWTTSGSYTSTSVTSVTVPAATWTAIGSGGLTAPAGVDHAYSRCGPHTASLGLLLYVEALTAWLGAVQVATTNAGSPLWTTAAGDFPFDILIAGEQITVTGITGASSPQTFTCARAVNGVVKAQSAAAAVVLFHAPVLALA